MEKMEEKISAKEERKTWWQNKIVEYGFEDISSVKIDKKPTSGFEFFFIANKDGKKAFIKCGKGDFYAKKEYEIYKILHAIEPKHFPDAIMFELLEDNKMFFSFEDEISDYANWIAYNRVLLSSCVGVYLHCNINFNIYRLFLSKDYQTVAYIYTMDDDDRLYRVCFERWDKIDCRWDSFGVWGTSIYDSVETAFNDIRYALKDYIGIEI
jgi:hypothetical protein